MNLSSLSIRRPVLAVVMSLVLVIFGLISFHLLGVREFPSVDPSVVSVTTNYPGANAEVIEAQITTPLEESINSIAGISSITSFSRDGRSTIVVDFDLGIDLETAANDVRDRVSQAINRLPPDVDPPIVTKADADSFPILALSVGSTLRNLLELTSFAEDVFKARLETIPGVSQVDIWGAKQYSMRLWMDPDRLAAHNLTAVDVRNALQRANVELPTGLVEGTYRELTVRTLSRLETIEDFNMLIVKRDGNNIVRFRDLGQAELGPLNERTILKRDGIPSVAVVLRPQPGSNQIAIVDEFYERLSQIRRELPDDITLGIGFDSTEFIRASIAEFKQTIFIAMTLVVLIIFLFLREWRTTLIPLIVIPISLISTFLIMLVAGFSINVLTMLGLVLAIGLVVDDAIVVLENIYAKIEKGMDPIQAGITGTKEIFLAVVATTISLVAVFLPILFLGGLTGRLFREFGIVLAGAVVVSSFVALTLTPMLSTRLLKLTNKTHSGWLYRTTEPFFQGLTETYREFLTTFLRFRWMAFPVVAICFGLIWFFFNLLPEELAPMEDRGQLILRVSAPEGATFAYMQEYMDQIDAVINETIPELQALITVTSPGFGATSSVNSGFARITLVPPGQRERTQAEIASQLTRDLRPLTQGRAFVIQPPTIGGRRGGLPVQFILQARTLEQLEEVLPDFLEAARESPAFGFVDVDLKFEKPEIRVEIDRERANDLGVSILDIAQSLQAAFSGQRFGFFLMDGRQYQVIGQLQRENRNAPMDLTRVYVRSDRGASISLDNLVLLRETTTPPQRFRFNRFSSATVSASLNDGFTLGEGIEEMRAIAGRVLDERFTTDLAGESRDYAESANTLIFVFLFALVLVYLVLAAQFESFRDPFTIMFTVPLALAGALFALWYFRETLNIFSQIGLIMLIGLITKNGILLVDFANQRKALGLSVNDAIQQAAVARFRPITMTSFSTILGILPIALALGSGATSRMSMGIAIIGGLIVGGFLTLFIIPALYTYISRELTEEQREAQVRTRDTFLEDQPQPVPGR